MPLTLLCGCITIAAVCAANEVITKSDMSDCGQQRMLSTIGSSNFHNVAIARPQQKATCDER